MSAAVAMWMLTSSTLPSAVASERICSATVRSSSPSQSVASPSVMLKTTGGKLSAFSGRRTHSAARSRMRRSASHIGVCPSARGSTQQGVGISRSEMPPSGSRYSSSSVRMRGSMAASSQTVCIAARSASSGVTSSSPW